MPYIKQEDRVKFKEGLSKLPPAETKGELNYLFTTLAIEYLYAHGLRYDTVNDVDGAFDNAKQEFYRRVATPYEDQKIEENGDVYPDINSFPKFRS